MYVATVPNRNSPPAFLLRESYRENGKVKSRTIANISHLESQQIEALRLALAGSLSTAGSPLPESFHISRSLPHGHVAAVLGCLRNLKLDAILGAAPSRQRDLVVAMIVARILDPASKLATARGLHTDTLSSSLGDLLHLEKADGVRTLSGDGLAADSPNQDRRKNCRTPTVERRLGALRFDLHLF